MDTIRPHTVDTRTRFLVDAVREIEYPRVALHPLHLEPVVTEPPETYPWGV